ncbi:hypothetical protein QHF83_09125 [Polyangium sp. 15x6]|nr:hypothetical protein [Polyangium sp. 15x6]
MSEARALAFFGSCHEGYERAQTLILGYLLDMEGHKRELESELKNARTAKRTAIANELAKKTGLAAKKINILKKLADSIAWQMIGQQYHVARRLHTGAAAGPVSATHHQSTFHAAQAYRAQSPYRFALLTDITTLVNIGDLLMVDRADRSITIAEVKSGKKNEEVTEFLNFAIKSKFACPASFFYFKQAHGEKGVEQAERVFKQYVKLSNAGKAIRSGVLHDLDLNASLRTPDCPPYLPDYDAAVDDCIAAAVRDGVSIGRCDDCLYIGAFAFDAAPQQVGDYFRLIDVGIDEGKTADCIKLTDGFSMPLAPPIFVRHLPREQIMLVTFGLVNVLLYLRLDKFAQLAEEQGLRISWLSKSETQKLKPRPNGMAVFNGRALRFDGTDKSIVFHESLLTRMLFQGITPIGILSLIKDALSSPASE